jgi:hypothetical protein
VPSLCCCEGCLRKAGREGCVDAIPRLPALQEEAFDLADKVVVFNRGLIEQQGSPTDIFKAPRTPFIMKFVGETNVVPATSLVGWEAEAWHEGLSLRVRVCQGSDWRSLGQPGREGKALPCLPTPG